MTFERSVLLRLLVVLLVLLPLVSVPASADDEDEEAPVERVEWQIQVGPWPPTPAVPSPALFLPVDGQLRDEPYRPYLPMGLEDGVIAFDEDLYPGYVPSVDLLLDLLMSFPLGLEVEQDHLEVQVRPSRILYFRGTPAAIQEAQRWTKYLLEAALPTLQVRATLTAGGEEPALLATGATQLEPGVWTGLYRVRSDTPLAVEWEIEIAQESTAMRPVVVPLPEGHELYLRYHPGASTSLVEVWSGSLKHLEVFEVDLSVIRNVPEASGPGMLQLPQTSAYRTYTVLSIPTDGASRRMLAWDGPAGPVKLVLDLEPARPVPAAVVEEQRVYSLHRTGAVAAALEREQRARRIDELNERIRQPFEDDEELTGATEGLLFFRGPPTSAERVRRILAAEEARLGSERVRLRMLRCSEASVRHALAAGRIAVGAEMPPEAMGSLTEEGGSVPGPSVVTPVLEGIEASVRVGTSVTGLLGFDVEVAQQAGGSDPRTGARFDGLDGLISLMRREGGFRMDLHMRVDWANPEAGRIDVVHRAPMSMYGDRNEYPVRDDGTDRAKLPVLGGGRAVLARPLHVPDRGREVLGGVVVRGNEAHLLLVSVLP